MFALVLVSGLIGQIHPSTVAPRGLENKMLYRHSDRWFRNVWEARKAGEEWAHNQSLRVYPPEMIALGSRGRGSIEGIKATGNRITVIQNLHHAVWDQIQRAYGISFSDFTTITNSREIRNLPPSGAPNGFDPHKVRIPANIARYLIHPAPNPPQRIPTMQEMQAIIRQQNLDRRRHTLTQEEKASQESERQTNYKIKIQEMEDMKKRQAEAERKLDHH